MPGVVIAGAGHAGGRVALQLRSRGFDGPITLVGKEPVPPYERPPLSKEVLLGKKDAEDCQLVPRDRWQELEITLQLGEIVTDVNPQTSTVQTASGSRLGYHKLVVATGGSNRRLDCPGSDLKHICRVAGHFP